MYRSLVVKLVLLNSLLGVAGCARPPVKEDEKEEEKKDDKKDGQHRGHTGSSRRGYHPYGGSYLLRGGGGSRSAPRPSSGSVSRGGFGSTGHSVSS